jgi:hypothetical protein
MASGIPITEDEFRERTVSNYREHFNHVYRLHEFAQTAIGKYKGEQKTAYHVCLVLILPKAFKSYDATRRLCEVASCEDAAVILRSLLNLMAVTRWLSLEPEKRGRKYLAWYWIAMQSDAENFKDRLPPAWIPIIQSHYDRVSGNENIEERRVARSWNSDELNRDQTFLPTSPLYTRRPARANMYLPCTLLCRKG